MGIGGFAGVSSQVFPHTANMAGGDHRERRSRHETKTRATISDLIPTQISRPDLVMAFDLFPLETIEVAQEVYATGDPGEMADGVHARDRPRLGDL